ncbi:MAG: hypothetical protein QG641_2501 [Candidatus Poribacteria bacterium]|nr:hypothetical protein [Candidatus Poribacteria bacterium]
MLKKANFNNLDMSFHLQNKKKNKHEDTKFTKNTKNSNQ